MQNFENIVVNHEILLPGRPGKERGYFFPLIRFIHSLNMGARVEIIRNFVPIFFVDEMKRKASPLRRALAS